MQHFKGLVKPYVLWSFLLIALPLVLVVLYSVTTGDNSLITIHFTLDNFKKIIFEAELWNPLLNTFIVTFFCGIAQLLATSLTGYGFARFKFKGCNMRM